MSIERTLGTVLSARTVAHYLSDLDCRTIAFNDGAHLSMCDMSHPTPRHNLRVVKAASHLVDVNRADVMT